MAFSFRTYLLRITYILIAISLFSCTKDSEDGNPGTVDPKAQIRLQLPIGDEVTRATETGSNEENLLKNLYLFIFDSSGNKELGVYLDIPYTGSSTDVDMSLWNTEKVITILNSAILSNLDMPRNIHIVSNVAQSKLTSITNETELKNALTDPISGEIAAPGDSSPLLMHSVCTGHVYSSGVRATVSLVRNVSKVRLTVNTTDNQGTNPIEFAPESKMFITAANVADRSYIVSGKGANPSGTQYIKYASKTLTNPAVNAGEKKFVLPAMYINENVGDMVGSPSPVLTQTPTYLVIQIPYDAGAGTITDNYYKVQINEDNDLTVNRNTIYDITLNIDALGGETEQTAPIVSGTLNVLPWNDKTLVSDLTQTYISVEATTLQLGGGQFDFQYATNAEMSKRSVTSSNTSWLTATIDNNNNIKITAIGTNYTVPRTATLSIKANDLTKVITIKQEAKAVTDGSISLSPAAIYLSTAHPSRTVALTVTNNAPWGNMISNTSIATYSPTSGTGTKSITFTRGGTTGNANFRFINYNTLSYADVQVCNLSLTSSVTELQVPGKGVTNATETGIVALGGNASWVVKSKPSWMTVSNSGGDLLYSAQAEPTENDRTGTIVLSHINDSDLTVSISVKQSANYIMFPEYDYMVISVRWNKSIVAGLILDTQIDLSNTGVSGIDRQAVGYGITGGSSRAYKGYTFLNWAGDNTSNGYMSYLVNMYSLCYTPVYDELPRYFNVNVFSTWYNSTQTNVNNTYRHINVSVAIKLYKGGTMSVVSLDYVNNGGALVYDEITSNFTVTTHDGYSSYATSCTLLGTIQYDKFKNTATFTPLSLYQGSTPLGVSQPSNLSVEPTLESMRREEQRTRMIERQ